MTASTAGIDVQGYIDASPLSRFQMLVVLLCFLMVAADGFDTATIGFIAPTRRAPWHLEPAQLAPLFASGLFGLMAGALVFGSLADRVGRKWVLVATTLAFGVASVVSAVGGLVAAGIVASHGWQGVLVLGGVLPILLSAVLAKLLPESIRYLVLQGGRNERVAAILDRIR